MRALALASILFLISLSSYAATTATILCWHEVDPVTAPEHDTIPRRTADGPPDRERLRYTATVEQFREELDAMRRDGVTVIPLAELVDFLAGRRASLPPKPVVITVDDGWLCAATEIAPEFARRHLPWTLFVYPAIVGHGSHAVSWTDVENLAKSGVDVESHTWSHPFLTLKNNHDVQPAAYDTFLRHELVDSPAAIESHTHHAIRFLSYPYGDYDRTVIDAVKRAGYEAAVTTWRGSVSRSDSPFELRRQLVHRDTTLQEFVGWLPRE